MEKTVLIEQTAKKIKLAELIVLVCLFGSIAAGLGVSIWRLFLDFSYEFGLNEVASDFREIGTEANQKGTLNIEKRTNIMSFSLGFLF